MPEGTTAPFVMHGAREAIADGLGHIEQQVTSIEHAVADNPGLAFDLAKTLVESVCKTALTARSVAFGKNDDLPKLFKAVSQNLPFLPPTASQDSGTRESLKQTLNGLATAMQGICELRNQCGFASHGSGTPRSPMESAQALLAAQAADTIVGFLYRIHRQDRTPKAGRAPEIQYERNPEFNSSTDENHEVIRIYELEFQPSQVLFQMDPQAYRVYLSEFEAEDGAIPPDGGIENVR